jgi:membrane protein
LLDNLSPFLAGTLAQILPLMLLCGSFAVFYMLMPNTRVHWRAALMGGLVGGLLWHLNNVVSVLYVSRWVSNSKIYGGLAAIPVIMVGLYFSWLILLFGAQVAYGWQNRRAYVQDKQAENINQRGREFIALRLMQCVGQRFLRGERAATVPEMAEALVVPSRLVQQIMQTLLTAGLLVEVAGQETAYSPARPLETINCHHILLALRAGQGEELATRDDPARAEVFGEFEKILEAEQKASSGVTVLAMVNRTEELAALAGRPREVLPEGKHEPPVTG